MWNTFFPKDFAIYIGKQFVPAKQIIISEIINLSDTIRFKKKKKSTTCDKEDGKDVTEYPYPREGLGYLDVVQGSICFLKRIFKFA